MTHINLYSSTGLKQWIKLATVSLAVATLATTSVACEDGAPNESTDTSADDTATDSSYDDLTDIDIVKEGGRAWEPPIDKPLSWVQLEALIAVGAYADFTGSLAAGYERLSSNYAPSNIFVAFSPGWDGEGLGVWLDPSLDELFIDDDNVTDVGGLYTIDQFGVSDAHCGLTNIDPETGGANKIQGICANLSVLHSLVDVMGVIRRDWAGVLDGENFSAELVKKVTRAGGSDPEDLPNRGLPWDQIDDAHEAEWNADWEVVKKTDGWIDEDRDDCGSLKTWCDQLEYDVENDNDDCVLGLLRPPSEPEANDGRAHAMTVWHSFGEDRDQAVEYIETDRNCYCDIRTYNTGKQDNGRGDYVVPHSPGFQVWRIYPDQIVVPMSENRGFWLGQGYQHTMFACWDEDPKDGVDVHDVGQPGDAFLP